MNPKMPFAEIYAQEILYMPWGETTKRVVEILVQGVPHGGSVLDVACGAGMLLAELYAARPDLRLIGVDKDCEYVAYARETHSQNIRFICADALEWNLDQKFDAVVCTSGIHHISWRLQEEFLSRMAGWMTSSGIFLSADPCLDCYRDEKGRRLAAARLGYEYLVATIQNSATDDVTRAAI